MFDSEAKRRAGSEDMLLTHELVESRRPKAYRERPALGLALLRRFREEVPHERSMLRP